MSRDRPFRHDDRREGRRNVDAWVSYEKDNLKEAFGNGAPKEVTADTVRNWIERAYIDAYELGRHHQRKETAEKLVEVLGL